MSIPAAALARLDQGGWGAEGRGRLGSASAGSVVVRCHVGSQAALAGPGAFLPQAEWSAGTGRRAGPAGGDLREASSQLPAGTKPALKGSAAKAWLS